MNKVDGEPRVLLEKRAVSFILLRQPQLLKRVMDCLWIFIKGVFCYLHSYSLKLVVTNTF